MGIPTKASTITDDTLISVMEFNGKSWDDLLRAELKNLDDEYKNMIAVLQCCDYTNTKGYFISDVGGLMFFSMHGWVLYPYESDSMYE